MEMNVRRKAFPSVLVDFGSLKAGEVFSWSDGGVYVNKRNLYMALEPGTYASSLLSVRLCDGYVEWFAYSTQVFIPKNAFVNVQVD